MLRDGGIAVCAHRWLNLYDLMVVLQAQQRFPDDPSRLRQCFAPLLCKSPREQLRFNEIFDHWIGRIQPLMVLPRTPKTDRQRPGDLGPTQRLFGRGASVESLATPTAPATRDQGPFDSIRSLAQQLLALRQPWLAMVAILAAIAVGASVILWAIGAPPDSLPDVPRPIPQTGRLSFPLGEVLLFLVVAVLLLLPILWFSWRAVLERRPENPGDILSFIRLHPRPDRLFDDQDVRMAIKALYRPRLDLTRRLNTAATVEQTTRGAGFFHPVLRKRRRIPEVVALIEQLGRGDQIAGLAEVALGRLRDAGLMVWAYYYQGSPRRLVGATDGRWRSIEEIVATNALAHVLGDRATIRPDSPVDRQSIPLGFCARRIRPTGAADDATPAPGMEGCAVR